MDSLFAAFQGWFATTPTFAVPTGSSDSRHGGSHHTAAITTMTQQSHHHHHPYEYNDFADDIVDPEVLRSLRRLDIHQRGQLWHVHCALAPSKATMQCIVTFLQEHPHVVTRLVIVSFDMRYQNGSLTVLKEYLAESSSNPSTTGSGGCTLTSFHIQSNGINNPIIAGHLLSAFYTNTSITRLTLSHVGFNGSVAGGACLQQLLENCSPHLQQLELAFVHLGLPGLRGLATGLWANQLSKKKKSQSHVDSPLASSLTHLCIRNCILGDNPEEARQSLDALVDAMVAVTTPCRDGNSRTGGGLESLHLADNGMATTTTTTTTSVSSTTATTSTSSSSNHYFVAAILRLLAQSRLKTLILGQHECHVLFQHHHHHHQSSSSIANLGNEPALWLARTLTNNHTTCCLKKLDLSACHDLPDAACARLLASLESNEMLQELILGTSSCSSISQPAAAVNDENDHGHGNRDINNDRNNDSIIHHHHHHHHHAYTQSSRQLVTSLPKIKGLRRLHLPWNVARALSSTSDSSNTGVPTKTTAHGINCKSSSRSTLLEALYRNTSLEHLYHGDSIDPVQNHAALAHIMKRNRELNHLKSLLLGLQQQQQQMTVTSSNDNNTSSIPSGLWLAAVQRLAVWQNATAVYQVMRQATFHDGSLVVVHSNYYHHHHAAEQL